MKSYKSTPKLRTNINYEKYQQSDIFIQKGLNKPEIKYTHKKIIPKNTFDSSYNFLEWKDMFPHFDKSIKVKLNRTNTSQILNSKTDKYLKSDLDNLGIKPKRKPFYEKMYETEPENKIDLSKSLNKNINTRYQKETMVLGDYKGDEYKIKKNNSTIYQPSADYLKEKNPLKQKMDIIYGGTENIIGDYDPIINKKNNKFERSKSSIGYLKKEFETNNKYDNKIINDPKKMKYFNIYGTNGIENAHKKLESMCISRSTNNIYTPGIDCTKNRINFLKSNIFYDEEIDKKNKEDNKFNYKTIKVNRHNQKNKMRKRANSTSKLINKFYNRNNDININNINNNNSEINNKINNEEEQTINIKNHSRKFLLNTKGEGNLPVKLDWKDSKFYLLFPQNKNRDILKKNSRQRKFKNLYDTEPIIPKEKLGQEFKSDIRIKVEKMTKNNYKNINYPRIRRISDNIAQYQLEENNKLLSDKNYNVHDINTISYEIIQKKNKNNNYNIISNKEIEKKFAKKGIHIYDIKDQMNSILNNKNMNKISFKIRENNKDLKTKEKINEIKQELIKDNIMMKEKVENKNKNNDIMPITLNWNNPHCNLLTKNKNLVNTNNGLTHIKRRYDGNNENEKITRIHVNLKYKNSKLNI